MKVLFVYPELGAGVRWTELLGLGVQAAMLKQGGSRVDLLYYKHPNQLSMIEKLGPKLNPDLIILHLAWDQWQPGIPLVRELRRVYMKRLIVASGVYPTLDPDPVADEPSINVLAVGETDAALNELVQRLAAGKKFEDLHNFWIKRHGGIVKNPMRPLIGQLDTLPFADRSLYDHALLVQASGGGTPMLAGRGCPYGCLYCYMPLLKRIASGKGEFVRARSPMNVIAETLDLARRERIEWVNFVDEYFPHDMEWLDQFCAAWKTQVRLPFRFTGIADKLNSQALQLLKDAGCEGLRLGVETGNEKFRARVSDRNLDNRRLEALAEEGARLGLEIETHNMVGLPLETSELARETLAFNEQLKPASVQVSIYNPIVGTRLHEYCRDTSHLRDTGQGSEFNPRKLFLKLEQISDEDVLKAYDDLRRLNIRRRMEGSGAPGGYGDLLAASERATVQSEFEPALDVAAFSYEGDQRLCLLQAIGSRISIPVEFKDNSYLSFGLAPGPSPYGIRQSRPILAEVSVRQNEFEEMVFLKLLNTAEAKPGESRPKRAWVDVRIPLFEWAEGPAEVILSVILPDARPLAPMYAAWSRPLLSGRYPLTPGATSTGDGETHAPEGHSRKLVRLENEIQQLRASNEKMSAELETLRADLDQRKARIGELRVQELETGKELTALREEKFEWMRLKEEVERSLGGKLKGLFKKK